MNRLKYFAAVLIGVAFTFSACKKDNTDSMSMPTGSFMASDQTISQNMIVVSQIKMSDDGWVVVHADNGNNGPMVPGIISEPVMVKAGTNTNVKIPIDTNAMLSDGEKVWIMLHTDDGTIGKYEFDGKSGLDGPIMENGNIVTSPIRIMSPSISIKNQPVTNNTITIDTVVAAVDGWLVVHNDDGTGNITLPGIIGKTMVHKGVNTNVVVHLDASNTYKSGQKLFPMLHIDAAPVGQYDFPGTDAPEIYGNKAFPGNVIFTSITVQ